MKNNNIYTMKRGSRSVVSATLVQAYIEHILSIYSAYIGTMWKPAGRMLRVTAMLCLLLMLGIGQMWGATVTFTFNTDAGLTALGISKPSSGEGTILTANSNYTISPISFSTTHGSTNTRVWNSSGTTSLRVYKNTNNKTNYGTLTFTSSAGNITAISLGSGTWTASVGTVTSGNSWSGNASSVTLSCTANATISAMTVTYTAASCTTSPTVTAGSNSSVTKNSARVTCSSGISSLGSAGCSITSYGFVLGTSNNPTTSNTTYEVGTSYASTGVSFYKDITGLSAGTTYYVRPYATNGNGTDYGTQTTFTTLFEASITLSKNNSDVSGSSNGSAKAVENATSLSSLSAPTRTGYHVEGYYTTSECETKVADDAGKFIASITVSGNTWTNSSKQWKRNNSETFYAKWTVNSYSVRFNKNDAGLINSATGSMSNESYDYGESKALTSCGFSVVGYDFSGWATTSGGLVAYSDGQTVSNLSTADGATVDLYAKWTIKTYTVTWKVNDASWTPKTTTGKGTDGTPNVNHGSKITTMPTDPSTDDFCGDKFMGWTDAVNGEYTHGTSNLYTKVSDFPNVTSGNVTYYAVFADYAE